MKKRIYNQTALFGPLYAYLAVLSPPEHIKSDIAKIKKELNTIAVIGDRNLRSIAHITLTEKLTDDDAFAETVAMLLQGQESFIIKLSGWGIFDHGHSVTVFINVAFPEPVIHLAKLLKSTSKTPHISLAKKISHDSFEKLKPYLDTLDYSAEWLCTDVNVLRKLMSEKHLGWRESFKIPLQ